MRATRGAVAVLALASVLLTAACTDDSENGAAPRPTPTPTSSTPPTELTFGVFGPKAEVQAFQTTVDAWNADPEHIHVDLKSWPDQAKMRAALEAGAPVPDVFLASRQDLSWLLERGATQPVDELLDERGLDFGDSYSRASLEAFSYDDRLQCMPYGVAPMVMFYNKRLVNFERMRARGLEAPGESASSWSFDEFAAAAQFATRPARKVKGVHIGATLGELAPFIQSGGGSIFDDAQAPTSLALSSDDSRAALERTLELLRNPQVTLDEQQLAKGTPLSYFERGKLAMMAGYRSLVPELRNHPRLDWDVIAMPKLDGAATVGDVTGLCMSASTASAGLAADFMKHQVSPESFAEIVRTGYLDPANVQVALSDDFLQPGRRPEHASVFNSSVRSMAFWPMIDTLPELEAAIAPSLQQLVYGVGELDLDAVTDQIDETSRTVLDPESASESPSGSPTGPVTGSASPSP